VAWLATQGSKPTRLRRDSSAAAERLRLNDAPALVVGCGAGCERHSAENHRPKRSRATDLSIAELAEAQGVSSDYFRVLLRVSYLAPDIVAAILEGRQPVQLNRQRLARATSLPISWHD